MNKRYTITVYSTEPTLANLINWAKCRLIDEMYDDFMSGNVVGKSSWEGYKGYSILSSKERKKIQIRISKFAKLLSLPISLGSLRKLRLAGYWNGIRDTYWENSEIPSWYKGQ